jgi:beta-N-acetylhexosaminidase
MQRWAKNANGVPLLVAADNEFGAAHRVPKGTTVFPLAMGLGATRRAIDARDAARVTAKEAGSMGFNWSLAPVADVNTNARNPVIGVRSFGGRPKLVGKMVRAEVQGLQSQNVIATPKHFPGHGATSVDSHTGLPVVYYGRKKLSRVHLKPFRQAIAAGTRSIMTGHVIVHSVDPRRPATLSPKVLTGILRRKLDFDGLIVTDDMTMAAISDHYGTGRAARMAARAGADVIMVTGGYSTQAATIDGLVSGVRSGGISRKRIKATARRVLIEKCRSSLWSDRFVKPGVAVSASGRGKSRRLAARIARRSITLVKNKGDLLPFRRGSTKRVLVTGVMHTRILAKTARRISKARVERYEVSTVPSEAQIDEAVRQAKQAKRVIVGTFSRSTLSESQARLVRRLRRSGTPVVAMSLGLPYDVQQYSSVRAYLATYAQGPWPSVVAPPLKAAIKVIFGAQPGGELPVRIGDRYPYGRGLRY